MNCLNRYYVVASLLLFTPPATAMFITTGSTSNATSYITPSTTSGAHVQLTALTLTDTGTPIIIPTANLSLERKEPTVTLQASSLNQDRGETIISEFPIPYSYISDHSMVIALYTPIGIPDTPDITKEKNYQEALINYQKALHLYLRAKEEEYTATTELVDKCNKGHYLKTKHQLETFVIALHNLHHKPTDSSMRTFVTKLADTLIKEAQLDTDDFVALWTTAQYLAIKPISAACAIGLAASQNPLPSTLILPRPLSTHLKAEQACKKKQDATALFNVLDECCLLEDVKGEKPLTSAKIWTSWRQHPRVEALLTALPRSQQKSELLNHYIVDHAAQKDFAFWFWYDQMLPGRNSMSPRNEILSTLTICADAMVKEQAKQICAALPESFFKMLVRQAYLRNHTTPLDTFPIEAVQQCFTADSISITLNDLGLTSLIGLDIMLALRNEVEPITRIILNNNQLTTIPNNFCKSLRNLQELNLADNKLAALPADFGQTWKYLSFLNLDGNHLATLPNVFGQAWKNLSLIKLDNNQLTKLPIDFGIYWSTIGLINLENNPCSNTMTPLFIDLVKGWRKRNIRVLI